MQENLPFERLLNMCSDVVVVMGPECGPDGWPSVVYVNEAFSKLTGYRPEEVIGRSPALLQGAHSDRETHERVRSAMLQGLSAREVLVHYARGGQAYWTDVSVTPLRDACGAITHYAMISHDQQADRRIDTHLRKLEQLDNRTGILNRRHLFQQAEAYRQEAVQHDQPLALLLVTVDYFRSLVDIHGQDTGDEILASLAQTLRDVLPADAVFGRVAGEEFAVLFPNKTLEEARLIARQLSVITRKLKLSSLPWLGITVSIGVSCLEACDAGIAALFSRASKAVEKGKAQGRNRVNVMRAYGQVIPFPVRAAQPAFDDSAQTGG